MRFTIAAILAALTLSTAACSTSSSTTHSLGCAGLIDPASSLQADLTTSKISSQCKRGVDSQGHPASLFKADGKLASTAADAAAGNDFAPRLLVMVVRYDQNFGQPKDGDFNDLSDGFQGTPLPEKISAKLGTADVDAKVIRLDEVESKITMACLYAAA